MGYTILLGVLRMPPELWLDDPLDRQQRYARYTEAADKIEALHQFIKNGIEFGYISIPDENDSALEIINDVLGE